MRNHRQIGILYQRLECFVGRLSHWRSNGAVASVSHAFSAGDQVQLRKLIVVRDTTPIQTLGRDVLEMHDLLTVEYFPLAPKFDAARFCIVDQPGA